MCNAYFKVEAVSRIEEQFVRTRSKHFFSLFEVSEDVGILVKVLVLTDTSCEMRGRLFRRHIKHLYNTH